MSVYCRYERQLGLVYQDKIENLKVLISGVNPVFPHLLTTLAFLGIGTSKNGGLYLVDDGSTVTNELVKGQLLFQPSDVNTPLLEATREAVSKINSKAKVLRVNSVDNVRADTVVALPYPNGDSPPLPANLKIIWGEISNFSIFLGNQQVEIAKPLRPNVLTPALSALCASLVSQEIIRINKCIRPSDVVKLWVSVNYLFGNQKTPQSQQGPSIRFRQSSNKKDLQFHQFPLKSEFSELAKFEEREVYRVLIPPESSLSRYVTNSIEILEEMPYNYYRPTENLFFSPINGPKLVNGIVEEPKIGLPTRLYPKKITLFGVGGVGSWLAALLAATKIENLELVIVDEDLKVEEHNLNRQILFSRSDLGIPKATAAKKRLRELDPQLKVRAYVGTLSLETVECHSQATFMSPDEFTSNWGESSCESDTELKMSLELSRKVDFDQTLAYEADKSDALLSCLDSLFARYVASALAYSCESTLVNAGSQHFEGNVDLITHDSGCILCWHGESLKYRTERVSCGEIGTIPTLAIVTTTSVVASLQTALLIAYLYGIGIPKHYVYYRGKTNLLPFCTLGGLNCPIHSQKKNCPDHLNWISNEEI